MELIIIILCIIVYVLIAILHYLMTRHFLRKGGMYSRFDRMHNIFFSCIWPISFIPIVILLGIDSSYFDEEAKW